MKKKKNNLTPYTLNKYLVDFFKLRFFIYTHPQHCIKIEVGINIFFFLDFIEGNEEKKNFQMMMK